ncbi:antitoxin VbhA family protein [Kribbella sp. HUAS MG21]|uniref:Antitoxin VbhA family protein n=1 Tax=Kribbella sp. HUAS MG21 TaxID=3160966 RepID=A0AAU7TDF0_9ACTN
MPSERPVDRLDPEKRHQLNNLIASWRMENMPLSDKEIDIFARYLLGEITAEQRRQLLDEQL